MPTLSKQLHPAPSFTEPQARWQALARRDKSADGHFVYAVKTTGVYCRPSCAAKRARRENIEFHGTPGDAERAGYRPCRRCKPNSISPTDRHAQTITRVCRQIVEAAHAPNLESLASAAGLSPSHFHRLFKSHTGLTPKAYAAAHRRGRVGEELGKNHSVASAVYHAGFKSNGRFYATSNKMLGMKPTAFRNRGHGASIQFAVGQCSLGSILVAATQLGICAITLGDDPHTLLTHLQSRFPKANLLGGDKDFERLIAAVIAFVDRPGIGLNLPLDVRGTAFQQRVWQKLCKIPLGQTRTYAQIAEQIGQPTATRAVAQACGANAVAVAIPCHRVIRTDGSLSGYRWGIERKAKLLESERAKT